jgi:hypothetical protein
MTHFVIENVLDGGKLTVLVHAEGGFQGLFEMLRLSGRSRLCRLPG